MIRLNIVCEGQTEENFVKEILAPHLLSKGIIATPHNLGTGTQYAKLRKKVLEWLKQEPTSWVTTLVDLYAMPDDFPGFQAHQNKRPPDRIRALEQAFQADVEKEGLDNWRFIPHYQLHEFEALLFSDPDIMEEWLGIDYDLVPGAFQAVLRQFGSPEEIDTNRDKAPSKQILKLIPNYNKPAFGMIVAMEIGLEKMRAACPHFKEWLTRLETLGN